MELPHQLVLSACCDGQKWRGTPFALRLAVELDLSSRAVLWAIGDIGNSLAPRTWLSILEFQSPELVFDFRVSPSVRGSRISGVMRPSASAELRSFDYKNAKSRLWSPAVSCD
jgi:hypothetical protein